MNAPDYCKVSCLWATEDTHRETYVLKQVQNIISEKHLLFVFNWIYKFMTFETFIPWKTPHIVLRTDRTSFFFGRYVRDTMCNYVFFSSYFGSILTQFRPGYSPQKPFFFIFFQALEYRDYFPKYQYKIDFLPTFVNFYFTFDPCYDILMLWTMRKTINCHENVMTVSRRCFLLNLKVFSDLQKSIISENP